MPKCPYCKAELELKLDIVPVEIDDEFRRLVIETDEDFIQLAKKMLGSLGGLATWGTGYHLKWKSKILNSLGALPMLYQTCKKCDTVINTEILVGLLRTEQLVGK